MKLSYALRVQPGDVVSLVGGGGKTTAMFRLAEELTQENLRVLTTTSTRIFTGQMAQAPVRFTFDPARQTLAQILPQLTILLNEHGQVLLVRPVTSGATKVVGLPLEIIDALVAAKIADVIIVEADGARSHSFKAPAEHEPVIPVSTTIVVPVVGLDVLGQPLDDEAVHRAALVIQRSDTRLGQPVTIRTIAQVLCHPHGGLKHVPSKARVVPLLNKAETPDQIAVARALADSLLACPRIDSVAISSVQRVEQPVLKLYNRMAVVVLAAGGSTRFGSPKQLAPWKDQTFLERVVEVALASQAEPVLVVLGAEVERSRAVLRNKAVQIIINPNWAEGQSTSVRAGLAALPDNMGGAVFMLVDQPGITPDVVDALIERYRQTLAPVVRPEYRGKGGNPVLFDHALFAELQRVEGDTGGRPLLKTYRDQIERVPVETPTILQDFDYLDEVAQNSG